MFSNACIICGKITTNRESICKKCINKKIKEAKKLLYDIEEINDSIKVNNDFIFTMIQYQKVYGLFIKLKKLDSLIHDKIALSTSIDDLCNQMNDYINTYVNESIAKINTAYTINSNDEYNSLISELRTALDYTPFLNTTINKKINQILSLSKNIYYQDSNMIMPNQRCITSPNRYINIFYNTIKTKGYVDKEYFMELLSLNEYQYNHTIEELLNNNVIVMSDGKYILSNVSIDYTFEYKQDDIYDTFSKIYDSNIYKEYEKISNGIEFEIFLSTLLNKLGYKSYITQKSNDFGADIIAEKDNIKYAIQCKFYSSSIGVSAIQEVLGGKEYYNCNIGIVATNSCFTKQAIELANKSNVILWDGNYILENFMISE